MKCKICDYPIDDYSNSGVCERDQQFQNVTKEQAIIIKRRANQLLCEPAFSDLMIEALAKQLVIQLNQR